MDEQKELQNYRTKEIVELCVEAERKISDKTYARKIVENIVFSAVGIILCAFLYGIINLLLGEYAKR